MLIWSVLWYYRSELGPKSAAHVLSAFTAGWTPVTQSPERSSSHVREGQSGGRKTPQAILGQEMSV